MLIRTNLVHEPSEGFTCITPSRTDQSQKDECDVNVIIANYVNTGVLRHTNPNPPQFGDFTELPSDYGEALSLIQRSQEEFMLLPSEVREKFDNKPGNLIKFLQDTKNRDEAVKLGLVNPPAQAEAKSE